ncbi:unnamed protein product [Meloidogyne enterolobii]|uniref:Uncharacterized protein n=1 Tax=Meloidogyne enterolobii TaxID=390850 RepID=A0ACB0ZD21_MELEN
MLDVENQNIFSSNILQKTFNLLQKCWENKQSILVHCESGISRSVTIIIAFLMKKNNWSYLNSFNFLKEKHSIAGPNNSFIKQLELFEKIGFTTDPINLKKSEIFRDFVASNGYLFELNDNTSKYNLEESYLLSSKKFSCKKCRKILFFDFNVLKHFSDNKNIFCEFGYLITPMVWMELDELKGKNRSQVFIQLFSEGRFRDQSQFGSGFRKFVRSDFGYPGPSIVGIEENEETIIYLDMFPSFEF